MSAAFWTEGRVKTLAHMWAEGLSAAEIAAHLGGVTRMAVIGKVHRLKLPKRAAAQSTPKRKRSEIARKRPARPQAASVAAKPVAQKTPRGIKQACTDAEGIRLLRSAAWAPLHGTAPVPLLERTGCCWPVDGPAGETLFCNAARDGHHTYCATHLEISLPAPERRVAA
ncbi:GcrA family cell cycle regulator [Pelagibacterium limicola]|uniref:GcrA family cell cycle regulator n=1 Tax=Pelagibacterium limicola TaxID=2791022 RepID=UPI001A9A6EBC|nr:GcrA family cell cycle regulator [Pelagibacterium limicola]